MFNSLEFLLIAPYNLPRFTFFVDLITRNFILWNLTQLNLFDHFCEFSFTAWPLHESSTSLKFVFTFQIQNSFFWSKILIWNFRLLNGNWWCRMTLKNLIDAFPSFFLSFFLKTSFFLGGVIIMEDLLRLQQKSLPKNREAVAHLPVQPPIMHKHL